MCKTATLLFPLLLTLWATPTLAQALSCAEVDEVGEGLTAVGIAMESGIEIGEGSELDNDLRDLVDALAVIAVAEDDADLATAAVEMDDAWEAMDQGAFTDALALAVGRMAVISATECE
jgi:hypothetical protein